MKPNPVKEIFETAKNSPRIFKFGSNDKIASEDGSSGTLVSLSRTIAQSVLFPKDLTIRVKAYSDTGNGKPPRDTFHIYWNHHTEKTEGPSAAIRDGFFYWTIFERVSA